jgi:predicted nucleic acid-binding protein
MSGTEDRQPAGEYIRDIVPLAREHSLSAYDAAYLGLAIRRAAPLATLDARLMKAAKKAGIGIFIGQ